MDLKDAANLAGSVAAFLLADKVPNKQLAQGVRAGAILYGAATGVDMLQSAIRRQKGDQDDGSPAAVLAQKLHDAIYYYGRIPLVNYTIGASGERLLAVANIITCWADVKKAYKTRFGRSLPEEIKERLDADQRTAFYGALERQRKHQACTPKEIADLPPSTGKDTNRFMWLVPTAGNVLVRTAPRKDNPMNPFENTRISHSMGALQRVYVTFGGNTGVGVKVREVYDSKGDVWYTLLKFQRQNGQILYFWMANQFLTATKPGQPVNPRTDFLDSIQKAQADVER